MLSLLIDVRVNDNFKINASSKLNELCIDLFFMIIKDFMYSLSYLKMIYFLIIVDIV